MEKDCLYKIVSEVQPVTCVLSLQIQMSVFSILDLVIGLITPLVLVGVFNLSLASTTS